MKHFIGTYECKADIKGRIMLPAALKKQLSYSVKDGFVIKRAVFSPCLELYPLREWDSLIEKINTLNRFVKKNNDFIRSYMSGLRMLKLDATGRLLIPKDLVVFASIQKEITLASAVNMVEIWDKQEYEESLKSTLSDFGDLAEEVMGNQSHKDDLP